MIDHAHLKNDSSIIWVNDSGNEDEDIEGKIEDICILTITVDCQKKVWEKNTNFTISAAWKINIVRYKNLDHKKLSAYTKQKHERIRW